MLSNQFQSPQLYAPPLLNPEEFSQGYIAHREMLARLLDEFEQENGSGAPDHQLLFGISGIGKSAFLQHLYISVIQNPKLDRQWLPLLVSDPQYNASGIADFWRNCLDNLEDAFLCAKDSDDIARFKKDIEALAPDDPEAMLNLIVANVGAQNKKLLLLIDDIDSLLNRSEEMYIDLLVALQNAPELRVVATASRETRNRFGSDSDLAEFFRLGEFKSLRQDEIEEAMLNIGKADYSAGADHFLQRNSDRFGRLHRLSGGNPRAISLLYRLIVAGVDGDISGHLLSMLNAITPIYTARMNGLSPAGQKIVDKVATDPDPVDARRLASGLGLTNEQLADELNHLRQWGLLEPGDPQSKDDRPGVEKKESLFYIWYLMYTARPGQRGPAWIARFLIEFFNLEELEERARIHIKMPPMDRREIDYVLALIQVVQNTPLRNALEYSLLQSLIRNGESAAEVKKLFHWKSDDPRLAQTTDRLLRLQVIETRLRDAVSGTSIVSQPFCEALLGSPTLSGQEKATIVDDLGDYTPQQWTDLERFLTDEMEQWRDLLGHHAVSLYKSIASGEMTSLSDTDGAESAGAHWQDSLLTALSWSARADAAESPTAEQIDQIEQTLRQSIEIEPKTSWLWNCLGNLLQFHGSRYDEAEQAYRSATEANPEFVPAWRHLAFLLNHHLDQVDAAEFAYRKVLELEPNNSAAYNDFAWFLYQRKRSMDEALAASLKACELDADDPYSIHTKATLLVNTGDWDNAVPCIQQFMQQAHRVPDRVLGRAGIALFKEVVAKGHAKAALSLLDELDWADQWNRVKFALEIAISGDSVDPDGANGVATANGQGDFDRVRQLNTE